MNKSISHNSGRTPLVSQVRKWMRQAHAQNLLERGGPVVSRRTVVRTVAAGLAATTLGVLPAMAANQPKIVIVGAGMAGLNAAYHLKKRGFTSSIYEGSNRTGGRMFTAKGIMGPGLTTELGGEFIDTGHKDMRDLAREFGFDLLDFGKGFEKTLDIAYYFHGHHFTEADVIAAFQPVAAVMAEDANNFVFDSYQSYNALADQLDHTSIADYLTQAGATGWLYELLDVAYNIEYGLESSEQSSLNLLYLIGTDMTQGFSIYGESDERFTIKGGNQQLTDAITDRLIDQISLGHKLVQIKSRGQGFRLTFDKAGGGTKQVDCDYALLTLPFTMLREVDIQVALPPVKRQAIDELGYGTNAKLIMGFNDRFWRNDGLDGEWFTDNGLQSGWDSSRGQGGTKGSLTYFPGGHNGVLLGAGTPEAQRNLALPLLNQIFPGATSRHNGRVVRFHWPTHPWTKGSYAAYRVGQYTAFSGAEIEPVGQLYFAGEHCSSDFQGYMNGAAETGRRAAKAIALAIH